MSVTSKYLHETSIHNPRAAQVILPYVFEILEPQSVLDVGCGTGTWLLEAAKLGCVNLVGIEGDHLDLSKFVCPKARLLIHDLEKPFNLEERFDLLLCLEVAEHLNKSAAEGFINSLALHSDNILFSAAIPFQGGQNHLNEQWPSWWQRLFENQGYKAYDILRLKFWNDENVFYWYKQNMILYSKNAIKGFESVDGPVLSLVHPELFFRKASQLQNIQEGRAGVGVGLRLFLNTLYRLFKH